MATIIHINKDFAKYRIFDTTDGGFIEIKDFDDGTVKICAISGGTPEQIAKIIVGCFEKDSNFRETVIKSYGYDDENVFRGIELLFSDRKLLITEENASEKVIVDFLNKVIEEENKRHLQEIEKLLEFTKASYSQKIDFKGSEEAEEWMILVQYLLNQKEGRAIVSLAETFVKYVQHLILEKKVPNWVAFDEAYDMILAHSSNNVALLQRGLEEFAKYWKYGNELSMWLDFRNKKELEEFLNS